MDNEDEIIERLELLTEKYNSLNRRFEMLVEVSQGLVASAKHSNGFIANELKEKMESVLTLSQN